MTARQGYVCSRCVYAEWPQAGTCLWCRAQLRTVDRDGAPQYCREFRLARDLTSKPGSGMVDVPNLARRHKRLSCLPKAGKSFVAYSACHARTVFSVARVYISRVTRPGRREAPAASLRPGSVLPCFFYPLI